MNNPRVIIGFGNPLRQDDRMGWRAAELIEASLTKGAADISVCHQLTPESVAKLEAAQLVVFLDASVDQAPGELRQRAVEPEGQFVWSHHLTPGQLLSLAQNVYGSAPLAVLITGGVLEINTGEQMTETGERCAARMAEVAINLLT
jgi:hydrogenase maturation protease